MVRPLSLLLGNAMRLVIDNTTRFFTVVGAPYPPERHSDSDDARHRSLPYQTYEAANLPASACWWLHDDR
jgi:hypothetical protein